MNIMFYLSSLFQLAFTHAKHNIQMDYISEPFAPSTTNIQSNSDGLTLEGYEDQENKDGSITLKILIRKLSKNKLLNTI